MTDDLVAWLGAQLDDDERVATQATPGPWFTNLDADVIVEQSEEAGGHMVAEIPDCPDHQGMRPRDAAHIARHDPARVLREVQAKRAIIVGYVWGAAHPNKDQETGYWVRKGENMSSESAIQYLAAVYADRPGYQEQWRPE